MNGFVRVYPLVSFTLPHFDDRITRSEQCHVFGERGLIKFLHSSIRRGIMFGVSRGITAGTAMVETSVELIDGASHRIVAIDKMIIGTGSDRLFAAITNVTYAISTGPLFGNKVFLVIEPL